VKPQGWNSTNENHALCFIKLLKENKELLKIYFSFKKVIFRMDSNNLVFNSKQMNMVSKISFGYI